MKILDQFAVLSAVAKGLGKWCMYVGVPYSIEQEAEVLKAAPCLRNLDPFDRDRLFEDGGGILAFDSEAECNEAFESTVGEDGPTKTNPYDGEVKVFATTCDPKGRGMQENT